MALTYWLIHCWSVGQINITLQAYRVQWIDCNTEEPVFDFVPRYIIIIVM